MKSSRPNLVIRPRRTIELLVLMAGILFLSGIGWLRLQQTLFYGEYLNRFGGLPPAVYLGLSGLLLGSAALVSAVGLWARMAWSPWLTRVVVVGAAAGYWLERLLFTRSAAGWANLLFSILLTLLVVGYALLVLESPRQKDYFASS
jgi:hypothetical protein